MKRRFSDQQLFFIRNHIPIRYVIESLLGIQSETIQGVFRFCCPLCAGYHTGIRSQKNLARCFDCGKNFNTIDIFMLVRRTDFVNSVTYLMEHKNYLSTDGRKEASQGQITQLVVARKENQQSKQYLQWMMSPNLNVFSAPYRK